MDTIEAAQKILPRNNPMGLRYVKPQLRNFARHEIAERRKDHRQMEITYMIAYMKYCIVAFPKKTNGQHSKNSKRR
jgi:hypothetical protein